MTVVDMGARSGSLGTVVESRGWCRTDPALRTLGVPQSTRAPVGGFAPTVRSAPGRREAQRATREAAGPGAEALGDAAQRHRGGGVRLAEHDRRPVVAALAQARVERDLAEQRHVGADARGSATSATVWPPPEPKISWRVPSGSSSQDMFSTTPTIRWWVCSAIDAGPLGHLGGRRLRGGDDEDLGVRDELGHRDRDVAGARGQVEQQDVEVAPEDVGEELLQRAVQHRPAPDDRLVAGDEHADRDDLHVVADGGRIMSSTWVGRPSTPSMRGIEKP